MNDTIADNSATSGGGIYRDSAPAPTILNCVIWNNGEDLHDCSATYSDLTTGATGSNISSNPGFAVPFGGNYHLSAGSPVSDVATSAGAPAADKDGIDRPWGTGFDMGAFEFFVPLFHTSTALSGPSSVKANKTLTLTGSVSAPGSPYAPPGKVTIAKTHKSGKSWKGAGSVQIAVSGGGFTYSFKPTTKGSWRFTATYSGGVVGPTTYAASASGVKGVSVK